MDISRVRFDKDGNPYVQYIDSVEKVRKHYGKICTCKECKIIFFSRSDKKGEYCSNRCQTQKNNHPRYKHGKYLSRYKYIVNPDKSKPFCREHRVIAEYKIGRPLKSEEVVHHIDRNRFNNHPSNLMIMTQSEHMALHQKEGL